MKQAIILFFVLLIPFRGTGQNEANEDGVKLEKKKMEKIRKRTLFTVQGYSRNSWNDSCKI